jgi:hypothetical protein
MLCFKDNSQALFLYDPLIAGRVIYIYDSQDDGILQNLPEKDIIFFNIET